MFGKRTAQAGQTAAPARPAPQPAPQSAAMVQPDALASDDLDGFDDMPQPGQGRQAKPYVSPPLGDGSAPGRLEALAAAPQPSAAPNPSGPRPSGAGPRQTPGFEQLKKAQAVAEIVS